jgi:hypothetical protein
MTRALALLELERSTEYRVPHTAVLRKYYVLIANNATSDKRRQQATGNSDRLSALRLSVAI